MRKIWRKKKMIDNMKKIQGKGRVVKLIMVNKVVRFMGTSIMIIIIMATF